MKINVFVSNLAKYNDGELTGQWTTLPVDDVNKDILDKLDLGGDSKHGYHDEWFISDYEAPFKIDEYDNLYALNELAEALEDYDTIEDVYNALDDREATGCEDVYDFDDDFFDTMFLSKQEVARAVFFGDIHNWLDRYIFINGCGNCESMTEYDFQDMLKDHADEIIDEFKMENIQGALIMTWKDYALKKIEADCTTTTAQLDDDVIYMDEEIILAGATPKELLELFIEKISNYAEKMNFARAGLVFWRMLNSIEYSVDMGMYIINVDRERLDKFVEPQLHRKEIIKEEIKMNEFKTKASQKKLDKFIELVLTKADKKGIRIASLCNDAIAVFTFNKLWEYDVINQAVVDNYWWCLRIEH